MSWAGIWIGYRANKIKWVMLSFHSTATIERLHPLDGGYLRRKYRHDRRPGLPLENPVAFYARYAWETLRKQTRLIVMFIQYHRLYRRATEEEPASATPDIAMEPVRDEELDTLELFSATTAARLVADRAKQTAALRGTAASAG